MKVVIQLKSIFKNINRTVSVISSDPPWKMAMPDLQRYPLKLCLIKYELENRYGWFSYLKLTLVSLMIVDFVTILHKISFIRSFSNEYKDKICSYCQCVVYIVYSVMNMHTRYALIVNVLSILSIQKWIRRQGMLLLSMCCLYCLLKLCYKI